jgi:hypothetical protein
MKSNLSRVSSGIIEGQSGTSTSRCVLKVGHALAATFMTGTDPAIWTATQSAAGGVVVGMGGIAYFVI